MSTNERDAKFEGDPGISRIWQAADHPEPSAELDRHILAAARQAAAKPAPRRQGWWRLAVPFSATAVLVLAVTLLLRVDRERPEMLHDAAAPSLRDTTAAPQGQARVAPPSATAVQEADALSEPERAVIPPPPAEAKAERGDETGQAPSVAPAAKEADRVEAPVAPPAPALTQRQRALPSASMELAKTRAAAEEATDPVRLVERIRRLLAAGQREAALEALADLRRRHPDFALPADLEDLR